MIHTYFTYHEVKYNTHNKNSIGSIIDNIFEVAVVIDVLRATSTIVTAVANGAKEIFAFENFEEAVEFKKLNPHFAIGGEIGGKKVEFFDFGNSPLEYTKDSIYGKTLILTTTNGTRALNKAFELSNEVYLSSFLNVSSTVDVLKYFDNVAIICAGNEGAPSYEDTQVAGKLIYELLKLKSFKLSDSSRIALELWKFIKKPNFVGEHAIKLRELGFDDDVKFCQTMDLYDLTVKASISKVVLEKSSDSLGTTAVRISYSK